MIALAVILVARRGFLKVHLLECYAGIRANAEGKQNARYFSRRLSVPLRRRQIGEVWP